MVVCFTLDAVSYGQPVEFVQQTCPVPVLCGLKVKRVEKCTFLFVCLFQSTGRKGHDLDSTREVAKMLFYFSVRF